MYFIKTEHKNTYVLCQTEQKNTFCTFPTLNIRTQMYLANTEQENTDVQMYLCNNEQENTNVLVKTEHESRDAE